MMMIMAHWTLTRRLVLGEDHPATVNSRRCLADACQEVGSSEAIAAYEQVIADGRRLLDEVHRPTNPVIPGCSEPGNGSM